MLPAQLNADRFSSYPRRARQVAVENLALLRALPLSFLPLLLREVIVFDRGFPAEQRETAAQLAYLRGLSTPDLRRLMAPFDNLQLSSEFDRVDWVSSPDRFSELLTTHLWATHQIDGFRNAAVDYMARVSAATPPYAPPVPRLAIVVIGQGVPQNRYPLFRRLRPHGVHFRQVNPAGGWRILQEALAARAAANPVPYGHWHIDGGAPQAAGPHLTSVSWDSLGPARATLLDRVRKAKRAGAGSEAVRTMLAEMDPRDLGLSGIAPDAPLDHFQVSLLTEGSGTQLFSTTFVQWAAREALRRAQPLTLLVHFAPRVRELSLSELLSNPRNTLPPDPQGSLIDADMGAYYTWLSLQRLAGADQARFLVWFEDHAEALAIGPGLGKGVVSGDPVGLPELLVRVASHV